MKKLLTTILLTLIVTFGYTQTTSCDSLSYIIVPSNGTTLTLTGLGTIDTNVVWDWSACSSTTCYFGGGQTTIFNQFISTDTIKLCYFVYLTNGTVCYSECDSLVFDGSNWVLIGNTQTSIFELQYIEINDNKLYDLLGREFNEYSEIPNNTVYIRNKRKCIKLK